MTQAIAQGGLTSPVDVELDEDDLERAAQCTTEILADVRLLERIERALHATGYETLRAIKVSVNARIVRLAGRVPSYYLKQMAQEAALSVAGDCQLCNGLTVVQSQADTI